MTFDLETTFLVLAVAQGFLLSIAFATGRRGNRSANRLFAALMLSVTIDLGFGLYFASEFFFAFPHLIRINSPLKYLIGPLLFLYVRSLIRGETSFQPRDWLHFSPVLLRAAYSIPFYLQDGEFKIHWLIAFSQQIPLESYLLGIGWRLQCLVYILLTLRLLAKLQPPGKNRLAWLTFLIFVFALSWGSELGRYLRLIDIEIEQVGAWLNTAILYVIGYLGLRIPDIITGEPAIPNQKYRKSPLTKEKARAYLARLHDVMKRERLYTDHALTLSSLAESLHLPAYQLSQLINEQLDRNFYDFVNGYRVEEVKRMLHSKTVEHLSLEGIAQQAGFKSTSAFNTAFKKYTGQTPSQYRASLSASATSA